ncbi:MAG: phage tail protein [Bacillota bacterium]
MSNNTPNLGLLKKDPMVDGNETFNIKTMLNENWDKIDEAVGQVKEDLGNVNIPDASLTVKGKVQLSSATSGARETVAATEKAVRDAVTASKAYTDNRLTELPTYTTRDVNYYVDAVNGNDKNAGTSQNLAFKTAVKAIQMIPDTINHDIRIFFQPGDYGDIKISNKSGLKDIMFFGISSDLSLVKFSHIQAGSVRTRLLFISLSAFSISLFNCGQVDLQDLILSGESSYGIDISGGNTFVDVHKCSISGKSSAIKASSFARVHSRYNSGSSNSVGLNAMFGAIIFKSDTQPGAKIAQQTQSGGVILS